MDNFKKFIEDTTVVAGDMAVMTPKLGNREKPKKRKKPYDKSIGLEEAFGRFVTSKDEGHFHYITVKEGEQESDGKGVVFFRTSPGEKNGHTHTIALTQREIDWIGDNKQFKKEISQDDGHTHTIIFEPKPLEENNNMETQETENYKFFETEDGGLVFELINEQDYFAFNQGYLKNNPRYWRNNPTTTILQQSLRDNKGKSFTVRYQGQDAKNVQNKF